MIDKDDDVVEGYESDERDDFGEFLIQFFLTFVAIAGLVLALGCIVTAVVGL
jgi:hypothetical protein